MLTVLASSFFRGDDLEWRTRAGAPGGRRSARRRASRPRPRSPPTPYRYHLIRDLKVRELFFDGLENEMMSQAKEEHKEDAT